MEFDLMLLCLMAAEEHGQEGEALLRPRGHRRPTYGPQVLEPLKKIWAIMDFPCGRRLKAILPKIIPKFEAFGETELELETRELLMRISGVDGRKDPVDVGDPCEEQGSGLGL